MDDRGRVPFALIGVVLLLASAAFVASTTPEPPAATPAVETAMDRANAETRTAVRTAVRRAGDAAARNPVLVRAETPAGRILGSKAPFRDALRVRIYLRARERLSELAVRQGDLTVSASLPPTPNASALDRAVERVTIARAGENGTALRATVENVTVVAQRGNRTVARQQVSPTVVVRTPVLELHEAVGTYERRLNREVTKPGLAQGLTARILQVAWIRGYAQYGSQGLISNVVDNGHVELTTNQAVLAEQRAVFGRSDAAGRRALDRATARVALSDLFTPWGNYPKRWVDTVLRGGPIGGNDTTTIPRFRQRNRVPGPDSEREVAVDTVADRAFGEVIAANNVSSVLGAAYTADVRLTNDTRIVEGRWPARPPYPEKEGSWQPGNEFTRWKHVEVTRDLEPTAAAAPGEWHTLRSYAFRVETEVERIQQWRSGTRRNRTSTTATPTYRVELHLQGRHARTPTAPARGIETVHERGAGPFEGPNLAGVERNATAALVDANGGAETIARQVIERPPGEAMATSRTNVTGARPNGLRAAVIRNLTALRGRLGNVSTTIRRDRLATMSVSPAGDLASELRDHREELVGAPSTYGSVAEKATVAARRAYFAHVLARLDRQQRRHGDTRDELGDALDDANAGSMALLTNAMENRTRTRNREATGRTDNGTEITSVDGAPPYLTVGQVGHEQVPAVPEGRTVHPLAAENVNAVTLPFADIADGIFKALLGSPKTVSLGQAALTLRATRGLDLNESFAHDRSALRNAVERKTTLVSRDIVTALGEAGVGGGWRDRNRTVTAGLARWDTSAGRARALANESALGPLTQAAARRYDLNDTRRAVVRARLSAALQQSLSDHQVKQGKVSPVAPPVRQAAKHATAEATSAVLEAAGARAADRLDETVLRQINDDLAQRLGGRTTNRVLAGIPIQPVGTWVTTVNVWYVKAKGGYPRFAVSARRGGPATDGTLTYVRERDTVRLDFDGDGRAERFGRNERIAFETETSVGVAVPPGPPGVGDMNGEMDERSVGWSEWTGGANDSAPPGWPPD